MLPTKTLRAQVQVETQRWPLLAGDEGTEQTITLIRQLVDEALADPYINRTAIEITRHTPQHDQWEALAEIYHWVLSNIRYVPDAVGKEVLRRAHDILELRAGDCDDINAVLLPSLVGSIGIPTRLVTITASPYALDFEHIYAEAFVNGFWIALDAARPGAQFGLAPEVTYRKRVWSLTDEGFFDLSGLLGQYTPPYAQTVPEGAQWVGEITGGIADIIRATQGVPDYGYSPYQVGSGPLTRPITTPTQATSSSIPTWGWIALGLGLLYLGSRG